VTLGIGSPLAKGAGTVGEAGLGIGQAGLGIGIGGSEAAVGAGAAGIDIAKGVGVGLFAWASQAAYSLDAEYPCTPTLCAPPSSSGMRSPSCAMRCCVRCCLAAARVLASSG